MLFGEQLHNDLLLMDRMFCATCQSFKLKEKMEKKHRGKTFRWICQDCLDRKDQAREQKKYNIQGEGTASAEAGNEAR